MTSCYESNNSPIKYGDQVDLKQLDLIKISFTIDQTIQQVKLPRYNGTESIEAIDYCHQRFIREATDNEWSAINCFKYFAKIIDGDALLFWNTQVIPHVIDNENYTDSAFKQALQMMISNFGGGSKA